MIFNERGQEKHIHIQRAREEWRLCKSEKNTDNDDPSEVMGRSSTHRNTTPDEDGDGNIAGGFDTSQEDVTGNLTDKVSDELQVEKG